MCTARNISFEQFVKERRVTLLFGSNRMSKRSELQSPDRMNNNWEVFTRTTKSSPPEYNYRPSNQSLEGQPGSKQDVQWRTNLYRAYIWNG